jgi:hypothetical protein
MVSTLTCRMGTDGSRHTGRREKKKGMTLLAQKT